METSVKDYIQLVAERLIADYYVPSEADAYAYILKYGKQVLGNINHSVTAERTAFDIANSENLKSRK